MPTHTTSGFEGSRVTHPIEYEACSSKIGVHVVPAFSVFQTPPEPTARYQVLVSSGWTAMSAMRPPMRAGPMPRSFSPARSSAVGGRAWARVCAAASVRMAARTIDVVRNVTSWRETSGEPKVNPREGAPRGFGGILATAATRPGMEVHLGVTRINQFRAREGEGAALKAVIESFLPEIRGAAGCAGCRLLQGEDDSDRVVVIEEWENVPAHRAAAEQIPREALERVKALLEEPARGGYFRE